MSLLHLRICKNKFLPQKMQLSESPVGLAYIFFSFTMHFLTDAAYTLERLIVQKLQQLHQDIRNATWTGEGRRLILIGAEKTHEFRWLSVIQRKEAVVVLWRTTKH